MSRQPKALRLADELYVGDFDYLTNHGAAEELRRLHALCEEMAGALESVDDDTQHGMFITGSTRTEVRAALAKWKESK